MKIPICPLVFAGFADDLQLLFPNLLGLQRMLNICKAFSTSTGLTFNAKKTVLSFIMGIM